MILPTGLKSHNNDNSNNNKCSSNNYLFIYFYVLQVSVRWSVKEAQFVLTFLQGGSAAMENPHRLVSTYIQNDFNKNLSLPYMVQVSNFDHFYKFSQCF